MTRYADPYVPSAVPVSPDDAPVWQKDIERFLTDELAKLATAVQQTSVMAAYGGLVVETPAVSGTANIAPSQVTDWDDFIPREPNRVTIADDGDSLVVREHGTYHISTQITADTTAGRVYRITLAVNDVLSPVFAEFDTSNQSDSVNLMFSAIIDLDAGDDISVWVNANINGSDFIPQSGVFQVFRISELRRVY